MEEVQHEFTSLRATLDLANEHMKLQKEVDSLYAQLYEQKLKIQSYEGLTGVVAVVLDELKIAKRGKRIVMSDETRDFMEFDGASDEYLRKRARKVLNDME